MAARAFMPDANAEAIRTRAGKAKSITVDGETITQRSISEEIEADRYAREVNSGKRKGRLGGAIRIQRLTTPGAGS